MTRDDARFPNFELTVRYSIQCRENSSTPSSTANDGVRMDYVRNICLSCLDIIVR